MKAIKSPEVLKAKQAELKTPMQQRVEAMEDRFQKELEAEKQEFLPYIEKKLPTFPSEFLTSMRDKLQKNQPLTDNMKNALRGMMKRDEDYEKRKQDQQAGKPIARMSVLVKEWWAKQNELASRTFTFDVMAETQKAYRVVGTADIVEGIYCFRCGQQLTEVASQVVGCGEICAKKAGVPYPAHILSAPKAEREKYRKRLQKTIRDIKFEGWLPKSQVKEVLKYEELAK